MLKISLTTSGLLDKSKLDAWSRQKQAAIQKAVAIGMRGPAHRFEIGHLHGRVHAVHHTALARPRARRRLIGIKLGCIDMAMRVDPVGHSGKTLCGRWLLSS